MTNQPTHRGYILTASAYKNPAKNWQGSFQVSEGRNPVIRQSVDITVESVNLHWTRKETAENALSCGAAWIDDEISHGRLRNLS